MIFTAPKFQRWLKKRLPLCSLFFDSLGLASSPEKDFPSATKKVSLGIYVNTDDWTFECSWFPASRLIGRITSVVITQKFHYQGTAVHTWQTFISFPSILVAFFFRPFWMLCGASLNPSAYVKHQPVKSEMRQDLAWWHIFLPYFNGFSVIKPPDWLFTNLRFTTDVCMVRGGAPCRKQYLTQFSFPYFVLSFACHISASGPSYSKAD